MAYHPSVHPHRKTTTTNPYPATPSQHPHQKKKGISDEDLRASAHAASSQRMNDTYSRVLSVFPREFWTERVNLAKLLAPFKNTLFCRNVIGEWLTNKPLKIVDSNPLTTSLMKYACFNEIGRIGSEAQKQAFSKALSER